MIYHGFSIAFRLPCLCHVITKIFGVPVLSLQIQPTPRIGATVEGVAQTFKAFTEIHLPKPPRKEIFIYIYIIISMQLWWNRQFWDVRSLLITGAKLFGNETSTAVIAKQTSVCLTETLIVKVEILTHDHDLRFTFELFQVR